MDLRCLHRSQQAGCVSLLVAFDWTSYTTQIGLPCPLSPPLLCIWALAAEHRGSQDHLPAKWDYSLEASLLVPGLA